MSSRFEGQLVEDQFNMLTTATLFDPVYDFYPLTALMNSLN